MACQSLDDVTCIRLSVCYLTSVVFQTCMSIPTLTLSEPPEELCPHGDYETDKGICCNKCSRGQKLLEDCNAKGQRSKCVTCPDKEYTDQENYSPNCNRCGTCKGTAPQSNEVTVSACQKTQNTVCRCKDGYYKKAIDSEAYECLRCTSCGEKEKEKRTCESEPQHFYTTRLGYVCLNCAHPLTPLPLSYLPSTAPDLIYTVLDLVPVLQVKQLVRSLGVKDAEIEQAEMDHRSCREAHYQMLRVWAERGSHAGAGGRGGMMHWHLLQELLDEVRKMHLGHAAEELETKHTLSQSASALFCCPLICI
uniref:Tumor necrosis factor receptor superfamily, member 1a n=1 Tax=Gasterosteus aculeatus aculeatus TaxID=481459 RepID=G3P7A3_GASAC